MQPDKAVLFTNGVLMVFDAQGQQIPEHQESGHEVFAKLRELRRDFPECEIKVLDWRTDVMPGLHSPSEDIDKKAK